MSNKTVLLFLVSIIIVASCNITKRYYIRGEYDIAIARAVKKIKKNSNKEKEIIYLEKSYLAANLKDNEQLKLLKLEGKPDNWDDILRIYERLKRRQTMVLTVLPLKLNNRTINFEYIDYDKDIVIAKQNAAEYWYIKGKQLLNSGDRFQAREAYKNFKNVKYYFDTYQDVENLILLAKQKGLTKVGMMLENNTMYKLPQDFKNEIFNVEYEHLDSKWVRYFPETNNNDTYHYIVKLNIKTIQISPEKFLQRETIKTKRIQDGTEILLDSQNNVVKDSLGNPVKVPRIVEVSCKLLETIQQKTCRIEGEVIYFDVVEQKVITSKPLASDYFFEHITYIANGDLRALDDDIRKKLGSLPIPFPNDMEMIHGSMNIFKKVFFDLLRDNKYRIK
jgi:hypothetical protein